MSATSKLLNMAADQLAAAEYGEGEWPKVVEIKWDSLSYATTIAPPLEDGIYLVARIEQE